MAARKVTPNELKAACQQLAETKGLEFSQGDGGKFTLMPGDIIVYMEEGRPKCDNSEILDSLYGILMDMAENAPLPPNVVDLRPKKAITPTQPKSASNGAMVRFERDVQVQDLTFQDIKNYICPAASDKDAFMFLKLCQARNLNPFTNEAYLIPYKDKNDNIKCSIIVGKEAIMRKAEQNPQYRGFKSGVIVSKSSDDDLIYREGQFVRKGETLEGGWAEVYRADRDHPVRKEVSMEEYSSGMSLWKSKPATMISKVAEVQAHRAAFPSDLAGCYSSDEMGINEENEVQEVPA